jgi:hypothetical protein
MRRLRDCGLAGEDINSGAICKSPIPLALVAFLMQLPIKGVSGHRGSKHNSLKNQ